MDGILKTITVGLSPNTAFQLFVEEINKWWPKEYTWSQDKIKDFHIEGWENGLCTEIGPYGFRCDWGRVTSFVKGKSIELKWQISPKREPVPDPNRASDIRIDFLPLDNSTLIEFQHFNFKNHGEDAESYKVMLDSDAGWPYIVNCFKKHCNETIQKVSGNLIFKA